MTETIEMLAVTTIEDYVPTTEPHMFYEVWKTTSESGESFETFRFDMEQGTAYLVSRDLDATGATNSAVHDARIHGWL